MLDRQAMIQTRAYALWEKMGHPQGLDWQHWFEAEKQVEAELQAPPPKPRKPAAAKSKTAVAISKPGAAAKARTKPAAKKTKGR